MNHTLILLTTHRGVSDPTYEAVMATQCQAVLKVKDQACIDRARSIAFDQAMAALAHHPRGQDIDTLLLIDDDMVFTQNDARQLVQMARTTEHPVSGLYANAHGKLLARQVSPALWMTGLGFMAVPRAAFERVADTLPRLGGIRVWCRSGELPQYFPDEWVGEDYAFCALFGGVHLAVDVRVGHLKSLPVWPLGDPA